MSELATVDCDICGKTITETEIHVRNDEVVCGGCCDCGSEPCSREDS